MRDVSARKRLKKKMLDRWENEGGQIATDTKSADVNRPTNESKDNAKKLSSPRENSMVGGSGSPTKRHKPTGK
jgi:hypothetical protein